MKIIIVFTMRADAAWESGLGTGTKQSYWSKQYVLASDWLISDITGKNVSRGELVEFFLQIILVLQEFGLNLRPGCLQTRPV